MKHTPRWCAAHRCTAHYGLGEHRSHPLTFPAVGGRVATVVSLVQRTDTRTPQAEITLRVRLTSTTEDGQANEVRRLLDRLNLAVPDPAARREVTR